MRKKLAVFDVDGTIFRSSLLIALVDELIREKIFKPHVAKIYQRAHESWLNREGGYEAYIAAVIKAFEQNLKGVSYKDFRRVAYKVIARERKRTYRYTRELVQTLKKKNYYVLAISHSPKLAVEGFCKALGFSKVYGLMYEVDKQIRFTNRILFPELIFDKAKVLGRAVEKMGLTLANSVGVGDTESDIGFLKLVAHPICFNPNRKLYQYAKRHGWKVVVERKDMVYEL